MSTTNLLRTQELTKPPTKQELKYTVWCLWGVIVVGLIIVTFHEETLNTVGFLWSLACLAAGWLIGFLFGIPLGVAEPQAVHQPTDTANPTFLKANTNLDKISDWLTKLLVGATLVELKNVPRYIYEAATFIAPGLTPRGVKNRSLTEVSFAAALLVYFSIAGFLGGYLTTRLFFEAAFEHADEQLRHPNPSSTEGP